MAVLLADSNKDFKMCEMDIDMLILRMCNMPSIQIDETILRSTLMNLVGKDINKFIYFLRDVLENQSHTTGIYYSCAKMK